MTGRRIVPLAALFLLGQYAAWGQAASPAASATPFASPAASATLFASAAAFATPVAAAAPFATSHGSGGMLQVLVYFVLIIAMLGAGLYFTRGGLGVIAGKNKGERKLVISETRTLGNRQFLIVAEYENRKMLLGVCPGRIDYLSTLAGGSDETFSTELPDKSE